MQKKRTEKRIFAQQHRCHVVQHGAGHSHIGLEQAAATVGIGTSIDVVLDLSLGGVEVTGVGPRAYGAYGAEERTWLRDKPAGWQMESGRGGMVREKEIEKMRLVETVEHFNRQSS